MQNTSLMIFKIKTTNKHSNSGLWFSSVKYYDVEIEEVTLQNLIRINCFQRQVKMQTGNILQIPFRRTQSLNLASAIKEYIASKYDQHPDAFARDLEAIDQLRKDAVNSVEAHTAGVRKLQTYAAQLVWMGGKFPVDIGADFTWYPSIGYYTTRAHTENNIRFELANVLFNLGAMYSQLGVSCNRATVDGLKMAANNFCLAAGVFDYLNTTVVPEMRSSPPEEMDSATLEALKVLMLAQAQECFWAKAIKDNMRDTIVAKLAIKTSDLYGESGEWSVKSEAIRSEWIHHVNAKHYHFAGAAQYRAALEALERQKYGEEVARLRDAVNCANSGLKVRTISSQVQSDLTGLRDRAAAYLKTAENDNDKIYLQIEPSKNDLPELGRASMVSVKVPKEVSDSQTMLGDHGELGQPLFTKLVPYSVHVAASIYADRRDSLVKNNIVAELEALTMRIHEVLSSLNLPGSLQALEKPLGLPPGLASHAEEVRQARGVQKLHSMIADTEKVKANNRITYQEGVELLQTEANEDEAARRKYGTTQWTRPTGNVVVPKLYGQVKDIEGYLQQADELDNKVQKKLRGSETLIRLLSGSDRDLEDYVPSSRRATMTAKVEREANALRAHLNEISRVEVRRRKKIEALKVKAKEDDINPDLLLETARIEREFPMQPVQASQFDGLFDKRLAKYDTDRADVKREAQEQDSLLQRLTEANTSFQNVKRSDTSSSTAARETALQNLENAYTTYKGIQRDLENSRKFYNDLAAITTRFRDECRAFIYSRRSEGQAREAELEMSMANLQIRESTQRDLRRAKENHQPPLQQQQVQQPLQQQQPLPAPTPQRLVQQAPTGVTNIQSPAPPIPQQQQQQPIRTTWQEGMPIVFNNDGGAAPAAKGAVDGRWDGSKGIQFARKN
jgi:programmed cell death 6-interacting protein